MTERSLFPDLAVSIEQRVQSIDAEILWLLCGKPGKLGMTLSLEEKAVLTAIRYCRGAANSVTIREMRTWKKCEALADRQIKQIVRSLRLQFALPIGSSKKGSDGGYFLIVTDADRTIFRNGVLDQVRAELEILRSVDGDQAALELLGQLSLQLKQNSEKEIADVRALDT
jgi:hypothetical protein